MIITLFPMRAEAPIAVERQGDRLIVEGVAHDLTDYAAGDCPWIVGAVDRVDGDWRVNLVLPHGAAAPAGALFPDPIVVAGDGPLDLPCFDDPEADPEEGEDIPEDCAPDAVEKIGAKALLADA